MRHKMVSLCPTTYEKAQKIENFSKWVREKLLEDAGPMEEVRKYFARCKQCDTQFSSYNIKRVPRQGKTYCPVCCERRVGDGNGDMEVWSVKESDL